MHRLAGPGVVATGDQVAFETQATVSYVSAINGGGGAVEANAPWAKGWETFVIGVAGASSPVNAVKQEVLAYLASIKGAETVAGQHNKNNPTPTDGTDQVTAITGKQAGLWSADFGFGADDVDARPIMIAQAQTEWTKGSIVQLMYHNCVPTGDELCSWDDIGGATPQHLTDAQWTDLTTAGGTLNWRGWRGSTRSATYFQQLKTAGVAPLFRPLHEINNQWAGGRGGRARRARAPLPDHARLSRGDQGPRQHHLGLERPGLHDAGLRRERYTPGPDYFDIAALDVYDGGYDTSKYTTMQGVAGAKPIAIGECETPPTSAELAQQPDWAFFMLWPDFIAQNAAVLPALYAAPNVVTLDRMPGW